MVAILHLTLLALAVVLRPINAQTDTLGLADGYLNLTTANFNIRLVKDSQTLASLQPKGSTFDFSPFDFLSQRAANGNYHVGDVNLRYRTTTNGPWTDASTATARAHVTLLANQTSEGLANANLAPTLPKGIPLTITRNWINVDGDLGLEFTITNTLTTTLELGSLGFPIEFNSIFTNRPATDVESLCSLQDPYIGLDAGYVQVTPVNGLGAALVVTPMNASFEAWRFLPENTATALGYQSQTFEGFYEFQVNTLAWAENEWADVEPWNPPTSRILQAKESITLGLRFSLVENGIRDIETTVKQVGLPYAISVPGYIIAQDMEATLFLQTTSSVLNMTVDPANAFTISSSPTPNVFTLTPSPSAFGRTRLTVQYANGAVQTIHYNIVKSGPATIAGLGNWLTTAQWFDDTTDPFHRAPSVISYDRSVNQDVLQDMRVWIAGLSDEGGAGSWLAATMKQAIQPNAQEIATLEEFFQSTLWGTIQVNNGTGIYGVRKSVFFYQPDLEPNYPYSTSIDWTTWESWDLAAAFAVDRAYDYVHVTAAYWAFYRVARAYPNLVKFQTWEWYLNQAFQTVMAATAMDANGNYLVGFADDGLMGETVWAELLQDLNRENLTTEAAAFEARMKIRAENWNAEAVPFGSEMAWDSTAQEGVYYWTSFFGLNSTATKTINSILGYMPTVAHWGWNGNARRYWDNLYAGKLERIERQIHHYGSGLNALPMLEFFRRNPTDTYVLRVAYGGNNGPQSNIDIDGFASASFHSWPDTLAWDAYSGDYGPNFVGLSLGSGTYIVQDPVLGLVAFGGNLEVSGSTVTVTPRDPVRRRVYVAPFGILIEIDAGAIQTVTVNMSASTVTLALVQGVGGTAANAAAAVVWIDNVATQGRTFQVTTPGLAIVRQGWSVPLGATAADVTIGAAA